MVHNEFISLHQLSIGGCSHCIALLFVESQNKENFDGFLSNKFFFLHIACIWKHTKFSLTIPSLAAKKARTWEMKCCSSSFRASQWPRSLERSTSSAVQNEASAFLYICQMSWYWIGKTTKRRGLSSSKGSTFLGFLDVFLIG